MAASSLTKVLSGGCCGSSSSHLFLQPPRPGSWIGRLAPREGGVSSYLLLPRHRSWEASAAPSSLWGHPRCLSRFCTPSLLQKVRKLVLVLVH